MIPPLPRHSSPFLCLLEELIGVEIPPFQLSPHNVPHLIQPVAEGSLGQSGQFHRPLELAIADVVEQEYTVAPVPVLSPA